VESEFAPRALVFHPAGEVHFGRVAATGARLLHVEISPRLGDSVELPDENIVRRSGPLASLARRLHAELRQRDDSAPLVIEGIALELLGALVRSARSSDRRANWLARAREHLHGERGRAISVQAVAAEVGVSPVRLSRAFRRTYGESLGDYHRRLRVEEACRLLRDGSRTLAEIALAVGFVDQSHFTRTFRRLVGATPAAFRRSQGHGAP
jgi:AraC family transcriptional regulator